MDVAAIDNVSNVGADAIALEPSFTNICRGDHHAYGRGGGGGGGGGDGEENWGELGGAGPFVDHTLRSLTSIDLDALIRPPVPTPLLLSPLSTSSTSFNTGTTTISNSNAINSRSTNDELASLNHAIRSILASILLAPNSTPISRCVALENLRESVKASLGRLIGIATSRAKEDSAVKRHFRQLASRALPPLGVPPLVYEIIRWTDIWEGTGDSDSNSNVVSHGLESILLFIEEWEEEGDMSTIDSSSSCSEYNVDSIERSGGGKGGVNLYVIVANACLQLAQPDSNPDKADELFQKLVPHIRIALACRREENRSRSSMSTTASSSTSRAPCSPLLNVADYLISSSTSTSNPASPSPTIGTTHRLRDFKGKGKVLPNTASTPPSTHLISVCTSIISIPRFAASLRDAATFAAIRQQEQEIEEEERGKEAREAHDAQRRRLLLSTPKAKGSPLGTRYYRNGNVSSTSIGRRPFAHTNRRGHRLSSSSSPYSTSPLSNAFLTSTTRRTRTKRLLLPPPEPALSIPFLALGRAWLLSVGASELKLSLLDDVLNGSDFSSSSPRETACGGDARREVTGNVKYEMGIEDVGLKGDMDREVRACVRVVLPSPSPGSSPSARSSSSSLEEGFCEISPLVLHKKFKSNAASSAAASGVGKGHGSVAYVASLYETDSSASLFNARSPSPLTTSTAEISTSGAPVTPPPPVIRFDDPRILHFDDDNGSNGGGALMLELELTVLSDGDRTSSSSQPISRRASNSATKVEHLAAFPDGDTIPPSSPLISSFSVPSSLAVASMPPSTKIDLLVDSSSSSFSFINPGPATNNSSSNSNSNVLSMLPPPSHSGPTSFSLPSHFEDFSRWEDGSSFDHILSEG